MHLSDLFGVEVRDEEGSLAGRVRDVRFSPSPPVVTSTGQPTWALSGLIVGRGGFAYRLGYMQEEAGGPRLLASIIRRLARKTGFVPWTRVRRITDSYIEIDGRADDLDDPVDRETSS